MKQEKKLLDKFVAKVAYQVAEKDVNSVCHFFYYQPKLPDSLMKLKKYK